MLNALVTLLVLILIFGVVWWIFTSLVPIPAQFQQMAKIVIALIFLLILIGVFFGGIDLPHFRL